MQYAIIIRSIIKISFRVLWVSKIEVDKYERRLKKRFDAVTTFLNTRKHHCSISINGNKMIMKITSMSTEQSEIEVNLP